MVIFGVIYETMSVPINNIIFIYRASGLFRSKNSNCKFYNQEFLTNKMMVSTLSEQFFTYLLTYLLIM